MSDTRVAMSEFRLLDDKRKLTPLSYAEEQRWLQLGQFLGIFESAGYAAFSPPAEHPQGYYADDGNWYPYPEGYDPNAYAAGAESVPTYGAQYPPPDPYAVAQHYQDAGYDPSDHGGYHSSAHAHPGAPQLDPPHPQDAGPYSHPGSGFEPNAHYEHHPVGQTSEAFGYSPTPEQPAEAPMEVEPGDIMEVDSEDVMLVEPEPVQARRASAIPELSLGLDLDSPEPKGAALANGNAPMDGGGRAPIAPALSQPEPSAPKSLPVDGSPSAMLDEAALLDFSETDPNAIQAAESSHPSDLDAAARAAPLPEASRGNGAGQETPPGRTEDELAPEAKALSPKAQNAPPRSPLSVSWEEAVAGLPSAATHAKEESAAAPGSSAPLPLDQESPVRDSHAALPDALVPLPVEPGPSVQEIAENLGGESAAPLEPAAPIGEPQRELLFEIVVEGVRSKPGDESAIDQRSIYESLEQTGGGEETAQQEGLDTSRSAPSEGEVDPSGGTVIDLLESETLDSDSREAAAETTDVEFAGTTNASLTASTDYAQSASSSASISYVEEAPSSDESADSPEPLLVSQPQAAPEPPQPQKRRKPETMPPQQTTNAAMGSDARFGDGTQMLGSTFVQGEHRVVIHTLEGQVKRGMVKDLDLMNDSVLIELQSDGGTENVPVKQIKAIFFMLTPEMDRPVPQGRKIRVGFQDGREVVGFSNDYKSADPGFFLTPADARTNTARIYVFRWSVAALAEL